MEKNVVTVHFANDRVDRAEYISRTVGFGAVIANKLYHNGTGMTNMELLETGVVIVRAADESRKIITMYIAPLSLVRSFYPHGRMPDWLYAKVNKNKKKGYLDGQPNFSTGKRR